MNTKLIAALVIIVILVLIGYAWSQGAPKEEVSAEPTPYVSDEVYQPEVI